MRIAISFLIGLLIAATVVALGVLVTHNGQSEQLTFLGVTLQSEAGWVVAAAAALGFVLAFLLLVPGRLASAWRGWAMSRQVQALEQRLRALREEHARLEGSHQRMLAEHQRVMDHVLTPVAASSAGGGAAAADPPRSPPPERPHKTAPLLPRPHQRSARLALLAGPRAWITAIRRRRAGVSAHVFARPKRGRAIAQHANQQADSPTRLAAQRQAGQTPHFIVYSDGTSAGDATAQAVLQHAEADYAALQAWFGGLALPPGQDGDDQTTVRTALPFHVAMDPNAGGAYHYSCAGTDLFIEPAADSGRA
jgi:hypothetical protein